MNTLGAVNRRDLMPVNPLIRKLQDVDDVSDNVCTYLGIYKKSLLFVAMIAVGVLLAVYFSATGFITVIPAADELFVERVVILLLLIAVGIFVIFPFLAFLLRVTIPVTGSLYCISVGFLFGFFAMLDVELGSYILLALALTLALVSAMGFLFAKGIIRVTLKLRAVTTTMFLAMVIGSLLLLLCMFVPFLRDCVVHLTANPLISAVASASGMVIAILFLLVDFDNIRSTVESQLPKKYEWFASFGLVFTVVWVYIKILQLVLQATNNGK